MVRVLLIVFLVGVFLVAGVAGASSVGQVRLPLTEGTAKAVSVVVARGDHLWKISARHLGPGTPSSVISPYWREVIEVNRPNLRSGDPDLIYPGEVIRLPGTG